MNLKAFLLLLLIIGLSALNRDSAVETILEYWGESEFTFEEDKQQHQEIDDFEEDIMFENDDYVDNFLENIVIDSSSNVQIVDQQIHFINHVKPSNK